MAVHAWTRVHQELPLFRMEVLTVSWFPKSTLAGPNGQRLLSIVWKRKQIATLQC